MFFGCFNYLTDKMTPPYFVQFYTGQTNFTAFVLFKWAAP